MKKVAGSFAALNIAARPNGKSGRMPGNSMNHFLVAI
jgi:hypothetical protein